MKRLVVTLCGRLGELPDRGCGSSPESWRLRGGIVTLKIVGFGCVLGLQGCGGVTSTENGLVIDWHKTTGTMNTRATLQIVVNPQVQPGQPLGSAAFEAVRALGPDDMRFQAWFPYPKLAVAELQPPTSQTTSWDFSLIDPTVNEFMSATEGHDTVVDFSTIPQWMFVTNASVVYPSDPSQEMWDYEQGTELRDPTCQELADYYHRLTSWYVNGGFSDENGVWHASGYRYHFPIWEVLNEPDFEHSTTAEDYTNRYDAIVEGVRSASQETKFMGMALGDASDLNFIQYFLDPSNHRPGIPMDYISYHFYAVPPSSQTISDWQYELFRQADDFLGTVQSIEMIRKKLAPQTKTDIDELGTILPTDAPPAVGVTPPEAYWNLSGALYAYLYVKLARMQIDTVGESQLVGFPTQYPTVSMMDWTTYKPNARFWVVKLLKDTFHPGDEMVETELTVPQATDLEAQAFETPMGQRLLLVNKRNVATDVPLPHAESATALTVDSESGEGQARIVTPSNGKITLEPFAVTVVSW